jgi:hypothetical protein
MDRNLLNSTGLKSAHNSISAIIRSFSYFTVPSHSFCKFLFDSGLDPDPVPINSNFRPDPAGNSAQQSLITNFILYRSTTGPAGTLHLSYKRPGRLKSF